MCTCTATDEYPRARPPAGGPCVASVVLAFVLRPVRFRWGIGRRALAEVFFFEVIIGPAAELIRIAVVRRQLFAVVGDLHPKNDEQHQTNQTQDSREAATHHRRVSAFVSRSGLEAVTNDRGKDADDALRNADGLAVVAAVVHAAGAKLVLE